MRRENATKLFSDAIETTLAKCPETKSIHNVHEYGRKLEELVYQYFLRKHTDTQTRACAKSFALQEHVSDIQFYCDQAVRVYQLILKHTEVDQLYDSIVAELEKQHGSPFAVQYTNITVQENNAIQSEEDALSNLNLESTLDTMEGKENWVIIGTVICAVCFDTKANQIAKQDRSPDEAMTTWTICTNRQCKAKYPT